jgi:hypothetical protein
MEHSVCLAWHAILGEVLWFEAYSSFFRFLYHLNPSDWINVGVSLGTIALAVFTWKAVRDSLDSINAATRSAQASELNAELMKDSIQAAIRNAEAAEANAKRLKDTLMPYLDLEIRIADLFLVNDEVEIERKGTSANLLISNNGTGPARI